MAEIIKFTPNRPSPDYRLLLEAAGFTEDSLTAEGLIRRIEEKIITLHPQAKEYTDRTPLVLMARELRQSHLSREMLLLAIIETIDSEIQNQMR